LHTPSFVSDEGYNYVLELFDLQADPYEQVNLAKEPAYKQHLQELQSWARQLALEMVDLFFKRLWKWLISGVVKGLCYRCLSIPLLCLRVGILTSMVATLSLVGAGQYIETFAHWILIY
jgi:hypothetical protein